MESDQSLPPKRYRVAYAVHAPGRAPQEFLSPFYTADEIHTQARDISMYGHVKNVKIELVLDEPASEGV